MDVSDAPTVAPRRRRWLVIGGAAGLVLLVIAVILVIINATKDSPADATERYLEAARDRNATAVRDAVCSLEGSDTRTLLGIVNDSDQIVEWRIISEKVTGQRADVIASLTFANKGRTMTSVGTFIVMREDGDWKVCAVRRAGGGRN